MAMLEMYPLDPFYTYCQSLSAHDISNLIVEKRLSVTHPICNESVLQLDDFSKKFVVSAWSLKKKENENFVDNRGDKQNVINLCSHEKEWR